MQATSYYDMFSREYDILFTTVYYHDPGQKRLDDFLHSML